MYFVSTATAVLLCVHVACVVTWPVGVRRIDLEAFWLGSVETESTSPSGMVVRHVRNDAGAAHCGLHYVWVIWRSAPWLRWRVVASGWSEVVSAEEAITWLDGRTFEIELAEEPGATALRTQRVQLKP